jgi:hypothetical protein
MMLNEGYENKTPHAATVIVAYHHTFCHIRRARLHDSRHITDNGT